MNVTTKVVKEEVNVDVIIVTPLIFKVTRPLVVACVLSGIGIVCRWTLKFTVRYVVVIGLNIDHGVGRGRTCTLRICASFGSTRLICASFGSTRLICASFESTRLICASLGITRLIGVSFGITRLICAFYGTIRLLCRVRVQRGANRREAGRMREGHMDASGFLYASADVRNENKIVSDSNIKMPLPLKTILRFVENVMDKDSGIRYQLPFLLFGIGRKTCVL
ncbi:hypothetical protein E5676_scaffold575G00100 [Cucumis melo var. makuwa]|uniref:Uncharacterized protein n=1 Tax=Cucumis melo var. makuwa TaxID=1194695 RepID=A0A5D3E382_CUCMM|nr:hypothetical protein E5676_scaffold575G00100 [Cucumis melo var. makuwa]